MLLWFVLWYLCAEVVSPLPQEYPNPQREWRMCGTQHPAYVCDPDFILERGEFLKLDRLAQEMKKSTSCLCSRCPDKLGISIGVYLKNNISLENSTYDDGKMLAEIIRQEWKLGKCEDDIILVLVIHPNISGFSLGSSVQETLTEEQAAQIWNDCQIHFISGYIYQGLESVISSFNDVIANEQKNKSRSYQNLIFGLFIGFVALLVLTGGGLALYFRQAKRRKQRCSNVYVTKSMEKDKKNLTNEQVEQLEKLNQKFREDEEDI